MTTDKTATFRNKVLPLGTTQCHYICELVIIVRYQDSYNGAAWKHLLRCLSSCSHDNYNIPAKFLSVIKKLDIVVGTEEFTEDLKGDVQ